MLQARWLIDKSNYSSKHHRFTSVKSSLASGHVLEVSERQFYAKEDALRLGTARKMQGLHAPLRLDLCHYKYYCNIETTRFAYGSMVTLFQLDTYLNRIPLTGQNIQIKSW